MLWAVVLLALVAITLSTAAPITDNDLTTLEQDQEESLIVSLLMIAVSEVGDKTFLIAAVMAMKHSRWAVFTGAFSALSLMALLSSWLGHVVPNLIPKSYTDLLAAALFIFFGVRMTWEARKMKRNEQVEQSKSAAAHCTATEEDSEKKKQPVLLEAFLLTFLGEWGDKSQISTIALAASNDVYWVAAGVIVGHGVCTALAVLGGRLLADRISVRTVTLVGAIMFFAFGAMYGHHAYQEGAYPLYKEVSTCTDNGCV